jgi:DNA-directed RNA polymerase specialized sigma24 family protein
VIFEAGSVLTIKTSVMKEIQCSLDIRVTEERVLLFAQLYEETFPKVAKFVANRGGTFDDAKDIFHDALVILYEKARDERLVFESPERYLIGIAKHLWVRKFNDDHKKVGLDEMEKTISIPADYYESGESALTSLLELTGRKCLQLLRAFYYDSLPLEQIKSTFGFSTTHSASAQKFKCIEKMRNIIREKSMGYEDFA